MVIIGYIQNKSFVYEAERNIYFLLKLTFAALKYTKEKINDLEIVYSVLSCGDLETSNNAYLE